MRSLISIVLPLYNEALSIVDNSAVLLRCVDGLDYDVELVLVDDGSSDNTFELVTRLAALDDRIKVVAFTRNFGKEAAIHAGLKACSGAAAVVMDADLQHPPSLVPVMIAHWEAGAKLVEAVKSSRNDASLSDAVFAKIFYAFYRQLSGFDISGHCDFKLLDRRLVDLYLSLPERYRFFRGLVNWTGVEGVKVGFDVAARSHGASRWNKLGLIRYALHNITSFSSSPLNFITFLGAGVVFMGVVLGVIALVQKVSGQAVDGFTTINLLVITIGGSIMVSLGIIGHYLGRIYDEIKRRPSYIERLPPKDEGN